MHKHMHKHIMLVQTVQVSSQHCIYRISSKCQETWAIFCITLLLVNSTLGITLYLYQKREDNFHFKEDKDNYKYVVFKEEKTTYNTVYPKRRQLISISFKEEPNLHFLEEWQKIINIHSKKNITKRASNIFNKK